MSSSRMQLLAILALAFPAWACNEWGAGYLECKNCREEDLGTYNTDKSGQEWTKETCIEKVKESDAIGAIIAYYFKCYAVFRGSGDTSEIEVIPDTTSYEGDYEQFLFCSAGATGDPHMADGRGGRFDFRGKDEQAYNLLSSASFSMNALFKLTDYKDDGFKARLVHGSFITAAYVSARTDDGRKVQVEFDATRAVFIYVGIDGAKPTKYRAPMQLSFGNLTVSLAERQAKVASHKWIALAKSTYKKGILRGDSCATGKCFLDLSIQPKTNVNLEKVAPHGLLGQAFDGADVSVIGKTDKYKGTEITTDAMGEGAIEGIASDYEVLDKFDTFFKYSRWGLTAAPPRDVSKLTGEKVKRGAQVGFPSAGAVNDGDVNMHA